MNICIVSEEFPEETAFGGIATLFYNQARYLSSANNNVYVISKSFSKNKKYRIKGTNIIVYRINSNINIKYFHFIYYRVFRFFRKFLFKYFPELMEVLEWNIAAYLQFRNLINNFKFHIIQTPEYHFPGLIISLLTKINVIIYINGTKEVTASVNRDKRSLEVKLISLFENFNLKINRRRLIANSRETALKLPLNITEKNNVPVIFPLLIPQDFNSVMRINNKYVPFILFAGRLEYRKGPDILLDAYISVANQIPDFKLIYIGRDTKTILYKNKTMYFSDYLNLKAPGLIGKKIFILKNMKKTMLKSYFKNCFMVVFPSRYEPFGLVAAEAMISGKVVISTNKGGPKEFIDHNVDGILVKPDSKLIAQAIVRVISNKYLRLSLQKKANTNSLIKFYQKPGLELLNYYQTCLSR